jgi:hypothetical protein
VRSEAVVVRSEAVVVCPEAVVVCPEVKGWLRRTIRRLWRVRSVFGY